MTEEPLTLSQIIHMAYEIWDVVEYVADIDPADMAAAALWVPPDSVAAAKESVSAALAVLSVLARELDHA